MKKTLYKSQKNKVISGVVGGLGEYFDVDATLLRLVWAFIVVFTGIFPGVILYIIAALIMPSSPKSMEPSTTTKADSQTE